MLNSNFLKYLFYFNKNILFVVTMTKLTLNPGCIYSWMQKEPMEYFNKN